MNTKMEIDVKRIRSLIDGIATHCETVAASYADALDLHGSKFTDALVDTGLERSWLDCLYDVGRGICNGGILFLSPDKRNIMRCLDIAQQEKIIKNGIFNKSIDKVSIDELRSVLGPKKHENMKQRKVAVRSHIRRKPQPDRSRPISTSNGLAIIEARIYSWIEIAAMIEQHFDDIPSDIVKRISDTIAMRSHSLSK